jgi:excisionase family DNA binding protein
MNQQPIAYRIPELARLLGASEVAARRLVERGALPSRRLGRRVVILREELEAHLRALPRRVPRSHGLRRVDLSSARDMK